MLKLPPTLGRLRTIDVALREWLEVGRSTVPADFDAAEAAIARLYERAGEKQPRFVRLPSPQAARMFSGVECLDFADLSGWCGLLTDKLRDDLATRLRFELRGQIYDRLWRELIDRLWEELKFRFEHQLEDGLGFQLVINSRDDFQGTIRDRIGRRIWGSRWDEVSLGADSVGEPTQFTGGRDYQWMWLDCGRRIGADYSPALNDALDDHITICRSIGWWYPYADTCILTDRPAVIVLDDNGWLHCETGPALRYRDGCSVWSLHGVRVNRNVVEAPESLTFAEVRDAWDVEERRHMLDRFAGRRGSDAIAAWIAAGGLGPISSEDITHKMQPSGLSAWRANRGDKPVTCNLYSAPLAGERPLHILTVVCTSTAKVVPLRVPPYIADAAEARAWTFDEIDLAGAVET